MLSRRKLLVAAILAPGLAHAQADRDREAADRLVACACPPGAPAPTAASAP